MHKIFAAQPLGRIGGNDTETLGPLANVGSGVDALTRLTRVVSVIIGIMTVGGVLWFLFQLLTGGLNWISSAGDKGKLEEARNRITSAFIGLVIVVAGWIILSLTGKFLGIDTLISDPGAIIGKFGL